MIDNDLIICFYEKEIFICRVDCLVAVGKKSSVISTTEKFYERLRDSRNNPQKMVNSPLLIADDVGDVLGEAVRHEFFAIQLSNIFLSI